MLSSKLKRLLVAVVAQSSLYWSTLYDAKYIFYNHPLFECLKDKIIEIEENEDHFLLPEEEQEQRIDTLEGGDVMMVAPNHLLMGVYLAKAFGMLTKAE